jgi:hypothetical protein
VDRLRKDICKFLSGQHGRGSGSSSTASTVRSTVSIQSDEERRRLQKRQANNYRMIVLERQLEECRREIQRGDAESSMGEFVSLKSSEKAERWKHNVVPESNSGRANSDEDFGGPLVAAIWKKRMSMSDGAPMADTEQRLPSDVLAKRGNTGPVILERNRQALFTIGDVVVPDLADDIIVATKLRFNICCDDGVEKEFMSTESLGVVASSVDCHMSEEERSTGKVDGRYGVDLLSRKDDLPFAESQSAAVLKLECPLEGMLKWDLKSRGPDLVPSLIRMLCHFGHCEAALSADIAEMYPHVWISNSSKGSRWCFVWMDGRSGHQRDMYGVRALVCDAEHFVEEFVGCCDARCCVDVCPIAVKATGAVGVFGLAKAYKCRLRSASASPAGEPGYLLENDRGWPSKESYCGEAWKRLIWTVKTPLSAALRKKVLQDFKPLSPERVYDDRCSRRRRRRKAWSYQQGDWPGQSCGAEAGTVDCIGNNMEPILGEECSGQIITW